MILAKVLGPVVCSEKHPSFIGKRMLLVRPINQKGEFSGTSMIAFDDEIRAGPGDTVIICREGNGCRQIWQEKMAPVNSVIVGVVDQVS